MMRSTFERVKVNSTSMSTHMSEQSDARLDHRINVSRLLDWIIYNLGLSKSVIASACSVHRREVFEWHAGREAPTSAQLATLHLLERLCLVCAGAEHVLTGRWARVTSDRDDLTLNEVLTADVIDEERALDLVDEMVRRSVIWSEQRARRLAASRVRHAAIIYRTRALDDLVRPISSERDSADTNNNNADIGEPT